MITQNEIQELLSYQANGSGKVVSMYLDCAGGKESNETIRLRARNMIKDAPYANGKSGETIERYLDHSYDWSKQGLALFSTTDGKFFRAYPTAVAFRNRVRVGDQPYIKPIAHLIDHYAHYGAVLIDRLGARFYHFHLGELQAAEGFIGEDVHKLKKGSGSAAIGMRGGGGGGRHEAEVIQRNMRDAAAAANRFFSSTPIRRIFLGGTAENVAQYQELLPKQLQSCVAGSFAIDTNANETAVQNQTLALLHESNKRREEKLVDHMITAAAKKSAAVVGLDDTLQAVADNRVQTLVISDGYRAPGYLHDESGFVVANLARSPLAENELSEIEDVVETAVARTMAQGGRVEVITDDPDLEAVGRIGAILRY